MVIRGMDQSKLQQLKVINQYQLHTLMIYNRVKCFSSCLSPMMHPMKQHSQRESCGFTLILLSQVEIWCCLIWQVNSWDLYYVSILSVAPKSFRSSICRHIHAQWLHKGCVCERYLHVSLPISLIGNKEGVGLIASSPLPLVTLFPHMKACD